jgi:aspartyl/asparaginyl-tRNA synthetase
MYLLRFDIFIILSIDNSINFSGRSESMDVAEEGIEDSYSKVLESNKNQLSAVDNTGG